jgi:hypothetical protein
LPYVVFLTLQTGQLRWETKTPDGIRWAVRTEAGQSWGELEYGIGPDLVETGANNTSDLEMLRTTANISYAHRSRIVLRQAVSNFPHLLRGLGDLQFGEPALAVLAGLGLFGVVLSRAQAAAMVPLFTSVGLTIAAFGTWPFFHDRFLFPLLPPMLVWAGGGLDRLRNWALETTRYRAHPTWRAATIAVGSLLFTSGLLCSASAVGTRRSDELSQAWSSLADDVPVGRWLSTIARSQRLMDDGPTVAFYSGAILVPFPWTDSDTAIRYIATKDIKYLVLRESDRQLRPYLAEWLDRVPDQRFQLLRTFNGREGAIRVYRWSGSSVEASAR